MMEFILQYWVEFGFGLLVTLGGFATKKINSKLNEQEALKLGLQALLRDRIIQTYNHHMEKGVMPIYARENFDEMTVQYFNLGGNGVVHQLVDKVAELPTSKNI